MNLFSSVKPRLYHINDAKYYKVSELIKYPPAKKFFNGCRQSPRQCLLKHNIDDTNYLCAIEKHGIWNTGYDLSFKKANLFLRAEYVKDVVLYQHFRKKNPEIINVFSKYVCEFPCIYLFCLGNASELSFIDCDNFDDEEAYLYKFGMTNNIQRRTCEHLKTYHVYDNVTLEIETFAYIHNNNLHEAETKLRNYFKMADMIVDHCQHKELVIIPKSKLLFVKQMYNDIYNLFNNTMLG